MSTPINTDLLRKAIHNFKFHSTPSNGDHSAPCSVRDIHKVVNNMAQLMNTFVDELESSQ